MTKTTFGVGDISRTLGISVGSELIINLGFEPALRDKRSYQWNVTEFARITEAIAKHVLQQKDKGPTPKPPETDRPPKVKGEKAAAAPKAPVASADDDWDDEEEDDL